MFVVIMGFWMYNSNFSVSARPFFKVQIPEVFGSGIEVEAGASLH